MRCFLLINKYETGNKHRGIVAVFFARKDAEKSTALLGAEKYLVVSAEIILEKDYETGNSEEIRSSEE